MKSIIHRSYHLILYPDGIVDLPDHLWATASGLLSQLKVLRDRIRIVCDQTVFDERDYVHGFSTLLGPHV